jgi:hypothetical protein
MSGRKSGKFFVGSAVVAFGQGNPKIRDTLMASCRRFRRNLRPSSIAPGYLGTSGGLFCERVSTFGFFLPRSALLR